MCMNSSIITGKSNLLNCRLRKKKTIIDWMKTSVMIGYSSGIINFSFPFQTAEIVLFFKRSFDF